MNVGNKLRRSETKPEKELNVSRLRVIEHGNECFAAAVDYRKYRRHKNFSCYDDDAANELHNMANKIAIRTEDQTFSGKDPMSVIAFFWEIKSVCHTCRAHEPAESWLFKQFLICLAEVAVKA